MPIHDVLIQGGELWSLLYQAPAEAVPRPTNGLEGISESAARFYTSCVCPSSSFSFMLRPELSRNHQPARPYLCTHTAPPLSPTTLFLSPLSSLPSRASSCVASAFAKIHALGYVYRDLKPENLLVDKQGYLRVIDFGFTKKIPWIAAGVRHEKSMTLCGTPEYLAPELVLSKGHDKAVDYWVRVENQSIRLRTVQATVAYISCESFSQLFDSLPRSLLTSLCWVYRRSASSCTSSSSPRRRLQIRTTKQTCFVTSSTAK